jgi:hypothetical protein
MKSRELKSGSTRGGKEAWYYSSRKLRAPDCGYITDCDPALLTGYLTTHSANEAVFCHFSASLPESRWWSIDVESEWIALESNVGGPSSAEKPRRIVIAIERQCRLVATIDGMVLKPPTSILRRVSNYAPVTYFDLSEGQLHDSAKTGTQE